MSDPAFVTYGPHTFHVGEQVIAKCNTTSSGGSIKNGEVRTITRIKAGCWLYFEDTEEGCGFSPASFEPLPPLNWASDELWSVPL